MKIKNLVIATTIVATIGGTTCTIKSKPAKAYTSQQIYGYSQTQNSEVMSYFTNNLQYNFDNYLNATASSNNLNKLLGYYDTLYDYINNGKYVKNTYFRNLEYYEQDTLNKLLSIWGNDIYDLYKNKSYFKTNCRNKLGFYLNYSSQETGYDREHNTTMEYYTERFNDDFQKYLYNNNSQFNLKSALEIYKKLVNFIKGNTRTHGYVFSELTLSEQEQIVELIYNWTHQVEDEYGYNNYYSSVCISKVGWTVNERNLNIELGEYINNSNINNGYYPNYSQNPILPTIPTTPGTIPPAVPSTSSTNNNQNNAAPIVPSVPQTNSNGQPINGTIGKDWTKHYIDPSVDNSRGIRDFVPKSVNDVFGREEYRYPQNNYQNDYYDDYYEEDYTPDYVPKYIPR